MTETNRHTERDIETLLIEGLSEQDDTRGIATFEDAGVMTTNKGVVLRMEDGSEFQITIVRSR
jgi:hypothetical protein